MFELKLYEKAHLEVTTSSEESDKYLMNSLKPA